MSARMAGIGYSDSKQPAVVASPPPPAVVKRQVLFTVPLCHHLVIQNSHLVMSNYNLWGMRPAKFNILDCDKVYLTEKLREAKTDIARARLFEEAEVPMEDILAEARLPPGPQRSAEDALKNWPQTEILQPAEWTAPIDAEWWRKEWSFIATLTELRGPFGIPEAVGESAANEAMYEAARMLERHGYTWGKLAIDKLPNAKARRRLYERLRNQQRPLQ